MDYIFIDESGDLGKASKYFVISAIKISNPKSLENLLKNVKRKNKNKIGKINEIKGSKTPKKIIKEILVKLNKKYYEVFIIIFNKKHKYKINSNIKDMYDILGAKLAELLVIDKSTPIIIDKSKNKKAEIDKFNEIFLNNLNHKNKNITIKHANSINEKGIQIADLVAWSAFQMVEHENKGFIKILENKSIKKVFED